MLLASDFPSSPSFAAAPGLSTFYEIQQLALAGISAREIFTAATLNGPRQFNLDDRYGTVETGKIANLLLLSEDPASDAEHWQSIRAIILHGQPIARESLAVPPPQSAGSQ